MKTVIDHHCTRARILLAVVRMVGTARPNTGKVCHGDRMIGRVTSQRRQRGERYWTAMPTMKPQTLELKGGVEVLVATPGRLLDHIEAKNCVLNQVEYVVLDEADRMDRRTRMPSNRHWPARMMRLAIDCSNACTTASSRRCRP